jgi:hypothetical protein
MHITSFNIKMNLPWTNKSRAWANFEIPHVVPEKKYSGSLAYDNLKSLC